MSSIGSASRGAATALLAAVGFAAACDHSTAPAPAVPARIVVAGGATVGLRAHFNLTPVVFDASGKNITSGVHITWSSSNTAIATVSDSGVVYGVALGGPVTITGGVDGVVAAATLSVTPADLVITPVIRAVAMGATQQMTAEPRDGLGMAIDAGPVAWTSSDPGIASVDPVTGIVTGVSVGNALISATAGGRTSGLGIFVGTVSPLDGVFINLPNNDAAQMRVFLGRITDFSAVTHSNGCAITVTAQPDASISFDTSGNTVTPHTSFTTADGTASVQVSFSSTDASSVALTGSLFNNGRSCATGSNAGVRDPLLSLIRQ